MVLGETVCIHAINQAINSSVLLHFGASNNNQFQYSRTDVIIRCIISFDYNWIMFDNFLVLFANYACAPVRPTFPWRSRLIDWLTHSFIHCLTLIYRIKGHILSTPNRQIFALQTLYHGVGKNIRRTSKRSGEVAEKCHLPAARSVHHHVCPRLGRLRRPDGAGQHRAVLRPARFRARQTLQLPWLGRDTARRPHLRNVDTASRGQR